MFCVIRASGQKTNPTEQLLPRISFRDCLIPLCAAGAQRRHASCGRTSRRSWQACTRAKDVRGLGSTSVEVSNAIHLHSEAGCPRTPFAVASCSAAHQEPPILASRSFTCCVPQATQWGYSLAIK